MGVASERAKELRAELRKAEAEAKAEAAAERQAARERQRAKDIAETDAFREENYDVVAGPHNNYVGVSTGFNGGIEVGIVEWTTHQTSASLSREEALKLVEDIQKLLG
jgi:hypothetical protein